MLISISLNRDVFEIHEKELEEKYKVIKFDIGLEEFFRLFKRVSLTASRKNQLKGKTIEVIELS